MSRIKKTKNQVIIAPSAEKGTEKTKKKTSLLKKPRSISSKENTLAYFMANPSNQKVKITQLTHQCKCSKNEVAQAQAKHKQQLVQKLAKDYKSFGESLGHYLHADIVGCAKELEK